MSEDFTYQDDTQVQDQDQDQDDNNASFKYTKIDCLDEDPELRGQKFALISFISPEGLMNCKIRGIKVRGIYASQSEAEAACEKLKKQDKYFDIFVGEVGKWLPWDPSTKQVDQIKYRNNKLDKIMKNVHKSELNQLNELVGRRKEMLDKSSKEHKDRIKSTVKESADAYDNNTAVKYQEKQKTQETQENKPKTIKNPETVRERLRKQIEAREQREKQKSENKPVNNEVLPEQVQKQEQEQEQEREQVQEKTKINEKMNALKEFYEKNKVKK